MIMQFLNTQILAGVTIKTLGVIWQKFENTKY